MKKSYVLVGTTRGDDLIPPRRVNIAVSDDIMEILILRLKRRQERKEWLQTHDIPWFNQESVFVSEEIEEVLEV